LIKLSLKGLLLLSELLIIFTFKLMGELILDFRFLLNKLFFVFLLELGSNGLFKLSLGLQALLFFLLGMEFGLVLRVHLSKLFNLFVVLFLLLGKEISSLLN